MVDKLLFVNDQFCGIVNAIEDETGTKLTISQIKSVIDRLQQDPRDCVKAVGEKLKRVRRQIPSDVAKYRVNRKKPKATYSYRASTRNTATVTSAAATRQQDMFEKKSSKRKAA